MSDEEESNVHPLRFGTDGPIIGTVRLRTDGTIVAQVTEELTAEMDADVKKMFEMGGFSHYSIEGIPLVYIKGGPDPEEEEADYDSWEHENSFPEKDEE